MLPEHAFVLIAGIAAIAFLYSSVGHAGASGYIAVMTLVGIAPTTIRPVALSLNICVACLTTWQFWRAGHFSWRLFWPFMVLSIPAAYLGGYLKLPPAVLEFVLGAVLLFSAWRLVTKPIADSEAVPPRLPVAIAAGAVLGFMAGLTGTGGGIFLTPLLLLMKWSKTKTAAAVSALFILVNSISGLVGNIASTREIPSFAGVLAVAAITGGAVGSYLGSRRFPQTTIKRLLACVLLVAGVKLFLA